MSKEATPQDRIEIVCVIDRSGSMEATKSDAIGSFNGFLKKQKALPGEANMTIALFNHLYTLLATNVPVAQVSEFTEDTYVPDGMTALLDAVGLTIEAVSARHAGLPEADKPSVIFAILTDGMENSSRRFSKGDIADMIGRMERDEAWEFIYLGVGMEAIHEAHAMGVHHARAYQSREAYVEGWTTDMNAAVSAMRMAPPRRRRSD